jgi:serine/threonine-protein kinase
VDTRADIWALGVVLYELLVNQPPFWRGAFAEVLASIMRDPAPPLAESLPDAPPELGAVIARCLEKEPGKRFANVAMLARALLPFGPPHAEAAVVKMERLLGAAEVTMDLLPLLDDSPSSIAARPSRAERTPPSLPAAIRNLREPAPTRGAAARIGLTAGVFLAGVAATLLIRQLAGAPPRPDVATAAPAVTASATAASATAAPSASSPPPAPAPNASASASSPPPAPAEVSITISTAPAGTRVYRGDALLGTVPGAVQLPRGAAALTLRFTADGYVPAELSVVPDMDRLLAVGLVRAPRATPSPPAPTTPKDLEPF